MTTSQKGFATPLLLALVALLILGGGAYAYVQTKQASQSAVVTSTTNYFEIKEVGLRFKITDDIKDLTYSIINEGNGATYVWFSTKTLENLGGKNCNSDQSPLGGIGVWKKDISGGAMAITYLIKSDNFFVTYGTPQSICSSVKEAQNLQMKQLRSLSEALKTIVRTDPQSQSAKTTSVPTITSIATSTDHDLVNIVISGNNFTNWATVEYLNNGKLVGSFCGYLGNNGELTHSWGQPEGGWSFYSNINQLRVVNADCRTADIKSGLTDYPSVTASISMVRNFPTLK